MVDDRVGRSPDGLEAEPTEAELADAARLRDELERGATESDLASLASALRAAHRPNDLAADEHAALVARAIAPKARDSAVVIRIAFAGASSLAAAAALVLWLGGRAVVDAPAPYESRSTAALFAAPFERGAASARTDRIAAARAAEFRDNLFAARGVR